MHVPESAHPKRHHLKILNSIPYPISEKPTRPQGLAGLFKENPFG